MGFTHFDEDGNAIMVDVSDKEITKRTAYARGTIQVNHEIIEHIKNNTIENKINNKIENTNKIQNNTLQINATINNIIRKN